MNPTEKLAAFIADTNLDSVPREVYEKSKWPIIDYLAVTIRGYLDTGQNIISFVKDLGGDPVSTILGAGFRTNAPFAAYANGTMSHVLDYDDLNENIGGHPTGPVLSAILAVGEMVESSGEELLLAYILGVETETKIGRATIKTLYSIGWHTTAILGTLGAAAACSKLFGLDAERTLMALGIAGSAASGLKQNFGTMTKPLHVGQAAKNGVLAAMLAKNGWVSDRHILEGQFGFCNLFCGLGKFDLDDMAEYLGNPWDIINPGIKLKKYPCCGSIHSSLDVIFKLLRETPLYPVQVQKVECFVHPSKDHILVHPRPNTGIEGKFSLEYCLAVALLEGKISLAQFKDEKVQEKRIRDLLPRISASKDSTISEWGSRVRIKTLNGQTISKESSQFPGITSWNDLKTKFHDCTDLVLGSVRSEQVLNMVQQFEKISNISDLIQILVRI